MTRTVFAASSSIGGHTTALPRGGGWTPPRREQSQTAATAKDDELAASGPDWNALRPAKLTHAERILAQDPQNMAICAFSCSHSHVQLTGAYSAVSVSHH